MSNFTGGKILTFEKEVCVSSSGEEPAMRFLIAMNIFLSFTALLGNSIILVALKESSLHPASRLLFICLSCTDLLVGVLLEPFNVVHLFLSMQGNQQLCSRMLVTNYIIGVILFGVSISTLTAISVDRLLALLLKLRYRQVVTLKRTCAVIAFIWLLNVFAATMYFWVHFIFLWYGYILITACFITSLSLLSLHKNLLNSSPSSKTTRTAFPRTTAEKNWNSTEYSTIQKNSVHSCLGAVNISSLLSSVWYSNSLND